MKDTISYSEFLFLSALDRRDPKFDYLFINSADQQTALGLPQIFYMEMVIALAEDDFILIDAHHFNLLIRRLRGEIPVNFPHPGEIHDSIWTNPREGLQNLLIGNSGFRTRITYRGLCRLETLRELLKRDRILEPFGAMLDMRYFVRDLETALQRSTDVPVSVLRLDLDNFKKINDTSGHHAGDEVMKSYLFAVRDTLGSTGDAYRGRGDEVVAIIVGQNHLGAVAMAEKIRAAVATMTCKYKGNDLPKVTTSIGVATSPPEQRGQDVETVADERQMRAKKNGKNCVVAD